MMLEADLSQQSCIFRYIFLRPARLHSGFGFVLRRGRRPCSHLDSDQDGWGSICFHSGNAWLLHSGSPDVSGSLVFLISNG